MATESDLTPYLASATAASKFGLLWQFNVASPLGSYETWGLTTTDVMQSVEVDIRPCAQWRRNCADST